MVRYRLDDLGWFCFEKLVQSLLKADLGLSVESWGGHGDLGRDAYARTKLAFPHPSSVADGPFLFQAKFVQGANAAGADWKTPLLKAVSSEKTEIRLRKNRGKWSQPAHYILLTNCPLTSTARAAIQAELQEDLPTTEITTLGGSDISDLLDRHPNLRRSFPEILSLRDLDLLISQAVSKPILERSRAAVEEARDLVPVFVPTQAYHKAWRSLNKHSFVVLDGPPEMGKTAIARTITLSHLISNWEAIECRNPNDLFSVFTDKSKQIFVADDAFGRTEYDPVLGRMWERDLPKVFQFLDSRHRLIWTTRKHILMRARREMDLTGKSSRFPEPGEVIVTADDLSPEEKARILYRHSRAARLTVQERQVVRDNAVAVVKNEHFTPERIRRLVRELLPEALRRSKGKPLTSEAIAGEISEAIRNPTDRMRKSFRKLPPSHTWMLIAFLECDGPVQSDVLRSRYSAFQPVVTEQTFRESLDDVLGTFLKLGYGRFRWEGKRIDWIHPSYRDLVIDELCSNSELQLLFLKRVSTGGVKLALSLGGGSLGERQMPLVTTEESWSLLSRRCSELASSEDTDTVMELLDILATALAAEGTSATSKAHVETILRSVCDVAVRRWNERGEPLTIETLKSFHSASRTLSQEPQFPRIDSSWEAASELVQDQIRRRQISDPSDVSRWSELADLINEHYASFAETHEFRSRRAHIEADLFELGDEIVGLGADIQDPDYKRSHGRTLEQFAEALSMLDRDGSRDQLVSNLFGLAQEYNEEDSPVDEDPDYEAGGGGRLPQEFDVQALFEDL